MIISAGVCNTAALERKGALFNFYFIARLFDGEEVDV